MPVHTKVMGHWTKVERVVIDRNGDPQVKETVCGCEAPAASRKGCAVVQGNKTPCRCVCHSNETDTDWRARRAAKGIK